LFTTSDLEFFLKEREEEWWSPNEIALRLGVDLRTVKNVIRRFHSMTHNGWVLELAERGDRLYCLRMVRDIEGSENVIKTEISEVKGKRIHPQISSEKKHTLDPYLQR